MDRILLIVVVDLLAYVRYGSTLSHSEALSGSEIVWLKDVTAKFQKQKRILGDTYLPDHLIFHVRRGPGVLTLKLKRNYEIDPNADIYFVERTKEGRSILSKRTTLEREAVAYYQDVDNGAYMTVRCINRLNQQCERIISGNIQIGDRSYEIRPAVTGDTPAKILKVTDSISRRYLLLDQTHIQQENLVENKDAYNVYETHVRWKHETPFRPFTRKEKQHFYHLPEYMISSRNPTYLQDRGTTDIFKENLRQLKKNYYVKIAILSDSSVWDLYSSKVKDVHPSNKTEEVKRRIREAFSHVMNGVNLIYKTIEDEEISITVIPNSFIFFLNEAMFPNNNAKVTIVNGTKYLEATAYLQVLSDWDKNSGAKNVPEFDHATLFTRHKLYEGSSINSMLEGRTYLSGVCDLGQRTSVVLLRHYVSTVQTAAHELGHNLGANHDGEGEAAACKPEDYFIMSPQGPNLSKNSTYFKNMWTFSNCSVNSFKRTLEKKDCVKRTGSVYNKEEYAKFMNKQAGDVFTPQEQCTLVYGPGYVYYGDVSGDLCYLLRCTDPVTRKKKRKYINAARGTICGVNKWCIDGRCVSKC